jgi:hypothetical protein
VSHDSRLSSTRPTRWRTAVVVGVTVIATVFGGIAIAASGPAPQVTPALPGVPSVFVGVTPVRVLDTRGAAGGPIGVPAAGELGPNSSIDVAMAGVFGIPENAIAVSVNVTIDDDATLKSFLTVYPTGQPRPNASTNNAEPGLVMSNSAIFQLGTDGKLTVYNQQGAVNVIIDVTGYFLACAPPSGGTTTTTTTAPGATVTPAPDCTATGGPTETVVSSLAAPWEASNPTVSLTPDGVKFGPYADGGTAGGSLVYTGLNGQPLSAVTALAYYMRYVSTGDTGGVGAPYLRIFTTNDTHDAIFSPNTQAPDPDVAEGPFHEWVATSGSWRYDDDAGVGPDMPYADLIAAHGTEVISSVVISTGFSAGTDLAALLRWIEINGQKFTFGG